MPLELKDKEILLSQSNSKTSAEWAEYFNHKYTKREIYDFCYKHSLRPKKLAATQKTRKYNINQDYFKTWNHNMAYIVGLWAAKGYVCNDIFDISLPKKDRYIIKQVAAQLGYAGNLYDAVDRQAARINFSCAPLCEDLSNISFNAAYANDLIRGYFDGLGRVSLIKGNRLNVSFSGTDSILSFLWDYLKRELNVKGSFDSSLGVLKFGTKDSIKIGNYMYKDNPQLFLKRKRDKFVDKLSGNRSESRAIPQGAV